MNKTNADRMGYVGARQNPDKKRNCSQCEFFTWWDVERQDGGFDCLPSCKHPMAPESGTSAKVALRGKCDQWQRLLV